VITNPYTTQDWVAVAPLFIAGGVALIVLLADLLARRYANRYVSIGIGLAGLIAAGAYAAASYGQPPHNAFGGGFILGGFSIVLEEIIIVSAIFSLVLYGGIGREDRVAGATALMLWSTAGAMLMAGAANLMTIFLGLELLSLGLYCLCGLADRPTARESSLKYLIL
jgi:NADH-quinone oxidoreductase subunit N